MAKVELKQPIVEEIKGYAADAKAAVLVDYRGLTVEQDTRLRKQLREAGVVYKVYKNTMLVRAFEGTDFAQLEKDLEGPTAIAFSSEDETAPARILNDFAKEAEALQFKSGIVAGTYRGRYLLRCKGNAGYCNHPVQRRTSGKALWKHAVTYYQSCPRSESDRREGWSVRRGRGC